ncbi:hypothetical protein [Spongiibacter marinus]|uniref:hypothetical protein n=1 Tax=Spongiibacter marinus TaxID=354246 RepID=UPI001961EB99|nr:hypothetical protein [Spongiibacter marinus]MBM7422907.1 hypothetical protein [Spongiibacter marinus]
MKPLRIHPELPTLLQSDQLDTFTVPELTAAYMALPARSQKTAKACRQFVYRNVLRLTEIAVLQRVERSDGRPRYRYVGAEQEGHLKFEHNQPPSGHHNARNETELRSLHDKLHRYNREILAVIGETEEYDALCSEFPELRSSVQQRYNDARDHCTKMLGRVRALEFVIADHLPATQS